MLTESQKVDLWIAKRVVDAKAKLSGRKASEQEYKDAFSEIVGKDITTTHSDLMRVVQNTNPLMSFNAKDGTDEQLVSKMTRHDMNGKHKEEIYILGEDFEGGPRVDNSGETGLAVGGNQSPTSDKLTLTTADAIVTIDVSKTLQRESILDVLAVIRQNLPKAAVRTVAEVAINGQGGSGATQDDDYAAKKAGNLGLKGLRALASEATLEYDFEGKKISNTRLRAAVKALGPMGAKKPAKYTWIVGFEDWHSIDELVREKGTVQIQEPDQGAALATKWRGQEVIYSSRLPAGRTNAEGGVSDTGFRDDDDNGGQETAGYLNVKTDALLVDLSMCFYDAFEQDTHIIYEPRKGFYEITFELAVAFNAFLDTANPNCLHIINIGTADEA